MGTRLVLVVWVALVGCGASGGERAPVMPPAEEILGPSAEPATDPAPAPELAVERKSEPTPERKSEPTPTAPAAATAPWYCYQVWDFDDPSNNTSGCSRDRKQCGRQRWELARQARDKQGLHIKTSLCVPFEKVACFGYVIHGEHDAQRSCHPSGAECERTRVANLDNEQISRLTKCAED